MCWGRKSDDDPVLKLGGTALRVYMYLLSRGKEPVGVRELQRALGFKSPSTAKHHLDRLVELGLAKRVSGGEYIAVEHKSGPFTLFIRLTGRLVPILIPLSIALLSVLVLDVAFNGVRDPPLLLASLALAGASLAEGIILLRWARTLRRGAGRSRA